MPIRIDYTPSSAAPAIYDAALGAGQRQFIDRRRAEQLQLEEMAQRERMQIRGQQAQLYSQGMAQNQRAQEEAAERQFRAGAMQFGAQQNAYLQQQEYLQKQEQEQDQWLNQQEESGTLIRDAASRTKLQKIYSQQGAIRSAQNLTPQDKQMKLMELDQQLRDERRGGLREPLPGERQKSFQERVQSTRHTIPKYDPTTGDYIGDEVWSEAPGRNGGPPSAKMDFIEAPRQSGATGSRGSSSMPDLSIPYMDPKTGIIKSIDVPMTSDEQDAYERAQLDENNAPTIREVEELGKVGIGFQFKGPNGDFFERDNSPQGYHPVPRPTRVAAEQRNARATQFAADQQAAIKAAEDKALAVAAAKQAHIEAINLEKEHRSFVAGMVQKTKPKNPLDPTQVPETYSRDEAEDLWRQIQGNEPAAEQPAVKPAQAPPKTTAEARQRNTPPLPPVPTIKAGTPEGEAELAALLAKSPSGVTFIDARDGRRKFLPPQAQ